MKIDKTKGIIAASYTPFNDHGAIDPSKISAYARYLKSCGVSGVFVNGTTGEGSSLTIEERMTLANAWISEKSDGFRVMIHVGHNCLSDAKTLAQHAQQSNADAIGLMAPSFLKPESLEALIQWNAEVASSASSLPYYYYHIPVLTGVNFPMIDFLEKASVRIPNLAGIKFTHEDLMDMRLCIEHDNQSYDILHGSDEILVSGLALGVEGGIGSTYNYIAPVFNKLIESFTSGNISKANELQLSAIKIIAVLIKYGGAVKAGKSIMKLVGFDFGKPRLPVATLSDSEEKSMFDELQKVGFEQCAKKAEF